MDSGMISLKVLYQHVIKDPNGDSIKGKDVKGREYGKKVTRLVENIPKKSGFYIWGKYEKNALWRTIYLGKAGYGVSTSLQARIKEELKDERAFLWHENNSINIGMSEDKLMNVCKNHYPKMWPKYKKHFQRSIRKSGTTHIIWVEAVEVENEKLTIIEADLIETMNPIANVNRPAPKADLQDITIKILKEFKHQIHFCRQKHCIKA